MLFLDQKCGGSGKGEKLARRTGLQKLGPAGLGGIRQNIFGGTKLPFLIKYILDKTRDNATVLSIHWSVGPISWLCRPACGTVATLFRHYSK